ncbi:hypothetical protein TIFTF001_024936 [Ficus carica]|uniref:Uncharacterized protein n=1 Tax=Ficus carica TaxID=3494 RepID=A0AA88DF64_FICCA|nr:hypothetical protein TIFTF001_024936 [Ficus carica]
MSQDLPMHRPEYSNSLGLCSMEHSLNCVFSERTTAKCPLTWPTVALGLSSCEQWPRFLGRPVVLVAVITRATKVERWLRSYRNWTLVPATSVSEIGCLLPECSLVWTMAPCELSSYEQWDVLFGGRRVWLAVSPQCSLPPSTHFAPPVTHSSPTCSSMKLRCMTTKGPGANCRHVEELARGKN